VNPFDCRSFEKRLPFLVLCDQLRLHLLHEPVLAPSGQIDLFFGGVVGHEEEHLGELVFTYADDAVGHVHEDTANVLRLAGEALLLDSG